MKGCIPEANFEGQGGHKILFTNLLILNCAIKCFENEGTSEKGCVEIEDWLKLLLTFGIGVPRKFQLHFTLMFYS